MRARTVSKNSTAWNRPGNERKKSLRIRAPIRPGAARMELDGQRSSAGNPELVFTGALLQKRTPDVTLARAIGL